jgi:hypothetical protein
LALHHLLNCLKDRVGCDAKEREEMHHILQRLQDIDPMRKQRYIDLASAV